MNRNDSYNTPIKSHGNFGEFTRPKGQFSPMYTSSPRDSQSDSPDFIPFGSSSPGPNRWRGRWRGKNKSFLSSSSGSEYNNSFSPSMGHRGRASPYNSPRGNWRGGRGHKGNSRGSNHSRNNDISDYYHHSMVEDPWATLEQKLQNTGSESNSNAIKSPDSEIAGSEQESSGDSDSSPETTEESFL